jgi:hypothetical protein
MRGSGVLFGCEKGTKFREKQECIFVRWPSARLKQLRSQRQGSDRSKYVPCKPGGKPHPQPVGRISRQSAQTFSTKALWLPGSACQRPPRRGTAGGNERATPPRGSRSNKKNGPRTEEVFQDLGRTPHHVYSRSTHILPKKFCAHQKVSPGGPRQPRHLR